MLEDALQFLGAGDKALATMGPVLTILLAWFGGGALAQALKYPLSRAVQDGPSFDWSVRTLAVLATIGFAHYLSKSLPGALEVVVGFLQPVAYWASLRLIRRFWPWLEVYPAVGSCTPPPTAFQAAAERRADQAGEGSGV